ncbi:hypothetical protein [Intestinimonas sp. MSJ-38]|uniref:hypothetical protein n=1 Tax=Intestinimonas sp. MSJ-38 TaxID=2841532 RepID=UPI000E4EEC5C|nr:hypothetical protein [Intestinimonas sp. MSJ-38]MBU5432764.1 hypothetical protein [Intestinimonas sp. MSJ-38]RHT72558.1 hypothetical protein DW741_05735 [Ruminococcaceae bacterium AM28-23LB]
MKLNTDIGRLVKGKKETYPTKKRMNLYFKVDRTTAPATAILYISFVVVVLVALSKVMILDPWLEVRGLEEQARQLEEENAALLLQLKDFSKVQEEYLRIAPTEEEQAQGDILEVLQLIDGVIRPSAQVKQVSVSENKVLLTFSGVTLGESAQLVSLLEQSPLVTGASVDTAVSREEDQGLSEVHVYFEINMEKEVQP